MDFSVDPHRMVRRNAPKTSHWAVHSVDLTKTAQSVYETVESFGTQGCISDEVQAVLIHRAYGSVTSQYSHLKDKGYIIIDHRTRKGKTGRQQHVMWTNNTYKEQENEWNK
jgi:hypothetical protein